MSEQGSSNTGLIIAVVVIVVVVLLLLALCACAFLSMGGMCCAGPGIAEIFSGINSSLMETPVP